MSVFIILGRHRDRDKDTDTNITKFNLYAWACLPAICGESDRDPAEAAEHAPVRAELHSRGGAHSPVT